MSMRPFSAEIPSQLALPDASFRHFGGMLDPLHPMVLKAYGMPWDVIGLIDTARNEERHPGRPPYPARLAFAVMYIKTTYKLSEEETVKRIESDPYLQYFCGYESFVWRDKLFKRSSIANFAHRFPMRSVNLINELICGKMPTGLDDVDESGNPIWPQKDEIRRLSEEYLERLKSLKEARLKLAARKGELKAKHDKANQQEANSKDESRYYEQESFSFDPNDYEQDYLMAYGGVEALREYDSAPSLNTQDEDPAPGGTDADASDGVPAPDGAVLDAGNGEPAPEGADSGADNNGSAPEDAAQDGADGVPAPDGAVTDDGDGEPAPGGADSGADDNGSAPKNAAQDGVDGVPAPGAHEGDPASGNAGDVSPPPSTAGERVDSKGKNGRKASSRTRKGKEHLPVTAVTSLEAMCRAVGVIVRDDMHLDNSITILALCDWLNGQLANPDQAQISVEGVKNLVICLACGMRNLVSNRQTEKKYMDEIDAIRSVAIRLPHNGIRMSIDATCAPSNIRFPKDSSLVNQARELMERLTDELIFKAGLNNPGVASKLEIPPEKLAQDYPYSRSETRNVYLSLAKDKKFSWKKARPAMKTLLDRLKLAMDWFSELRDKLPDVKLRRVNESRLPVVQRVYEQQLEMYVNRTHVVPDRICSIRQDMVRPIRRDKVRGKYEFGQKIHLMDADGCTYMLRSSWDQFNESCDLPGAVLQCNELHGAFPEAVLADQIYQTATNKAFCRCLGVRLSGRRLKQKEETAAREPDAEYASSDGRARSIIEGRCGTLKTRYGLDCVMEILPDRQQSSAAMSFLAMNLNNAVSRQLRAEKEAERDAFQACLEKAAAEKKQLTQAAS